VSGREWSADDLPLLGTEPFAVEFANALYDGADERFDVFDDVPATAAWFFHVGDRAGIPPTPHIDGSLLSDLRDVRAAVRCLLDPTCADRATMIAVLNAAACRSACHVALIDGTRPRWELRHAGDSPDAFVAAIASRLIQFVADPAAMRVRRCARPGCPMLYVPTHRSRRFCHESCAHRARQARYYRSRRLPPSEVSS
jgi:predicted RNA-binding Zn ribbon-like protein